MRKNDSCFYIFLNIDFFLLNNNDKKENYILKNEFLIIKIKPKFLNLYISIQFIVRLTNFIFEFFHEINFISIEF